VYEGVQEAIREKRDYTVEFRIVLPDGTVKYLQSCSRHLFSERGELVEVLGTHIDVTERKRAEEALRESEYKLRQIIDTVPGFLWSADPAGEPTHINQHMLDYSGMRFEDFRHGGWEAFVHPDDFPETARALYHAIQTGTSYQAVNRLRRADGEFRWHHTRGEPLRDQQGRIIQWYGLSVDIDDGKKSFAAQLQAILNVLPAYTWYAAPSGGLTFVNKRTADYLGVPEDHPLRFGIDIGAQWDDWIPLLHPDDQKKHANTGQTVCARARPVSIVIEFVALKETTTGSSLASNRSGQAMETYCCGSGRLWILKSSSAPSKHCGRAKASSATTPKPPPIGFGKSALTTSSRC